jgi:hypothetical protein
MHVWIVLAAFALVAAAPYMGSPPRSDLTQIAEDWSDVEQGEDVDDIDEA